MAGHPDSAWHQQFFPTKGQGTASNRVEFNSLHEGSFSTREQTVLFHASSGDVDGLRLALDAAAREGPEDSLRKAVNGAAEEEGPLSFGYTPMHYAAYSDLLEVGGLLLATGACDLRAVATRGNTALHTAAASRSHRVLALLLPHCARGPPVATTTTTTTAAAAAAAAASLLHVDARNEWGESALHLACAASFRRGVELLLSAGASATATDKWGRTPMQVLSELDDYETLALFRARGLAGQTGDASSGSPDGDEQKQQQQQQQQQQQGKQPMHHAELQAEFMQQVSLRSEAPPPVEPTVVRGIFRAEERGGGGVAGAAAAAAAATAAAAAAGKKKKNMDECPPPLPPRPSSRPVTDQQQQPPREPQQRLPALSKVLEYPAPSREEFLLLLSQGTLDVRGVDMYGVTALMKLSAWNRDDLLDDLLSVLKADAAETAPALDAPAAAAAAAAGGGGGAAQSTSLSSPSSSLSFLAHLNKADASGFTALHHAADMGAARAFHRLLAEGGMLREVRDKKGRTALHIAAESGN
jgi:ankyrin repeat protein